MAVSRNTTVAPADLALTKRGERYAALHAERPTLRARMERAVERLLAALDAIDALDADIEPQGDEEPSLGAPERHPSLFMPDRSNTGHQLDWALSDGRELEDEHDGREPDESDAEPELGATVDLDQETAWAPAAGWVDDGEPALASTAAEDARGCHAVTDPDADGREEDHDRESDLAELHGIGDADGLAEQTGRAY